MRQWMVAAKKADFYAIAEKFHVDPVVARIIRNREVIGEENIRIYLGGNLSDLSDPHQMKDMDRLVDILGQKEAKSCVPTSACAAFFILSTSSVCPY